jgi:hypothetical protein
LPDEKPGELRALLEKWTDVYKPRSALERDLLAMVVADLIRIRRCRRWQDAQEERLGRRARLQHPNHAEVLTARRDSERMFHVNYKRLLELRKQPTPAAVPLETSLDAGLAPRRGRTPVH